jgi:DMSO/TMAO reductase YedYZ molybdopterin-dependent catalytic subunit
MKLTRRSLFALAAGAGLANRFSIAAAAGKDLTINSTRPKDYEMTLAGFSHWITPDDSFFVRCHHFTPDIQPSAWTLKIDGEVNQPLTLSMSDLRALPRTSYIAVLECAGNGRSFYEPHVPGMQWKYGGVANGKWTGVRLADVLEKAGVKSSAKQILFDSADVPIGKMPKFERTITAEKGFHPDTMLAFELNDKPIPIDHGYPLRLIVPGWAGASWVKWVKHIEVLDHEFDGFWMKTAYRHPVQPVAPGTAVPPDQMAPVTDLVLKSVIAAPVGNWVRPGRVKIRGAAWSNGHPITGVEVSTDNGISWQAARLGRDQSQYAWRFFEYDWIASAGSYTIRSRAKDSSGNVQPTEPQWNPSGYLWNVASRQVSVSRVEGHAAPANQTVPPPPAGFESACLTCHEGDIIRMQKLTGPQWDREVTKMMNWGAEVRPDERDAILEYLKANFKQ